MCLSNVHNAVVCRSMSNHFCQISMLDAQRHLHPETQMYLYTMPVIGDPCLPCPLASYTRVGHRLSLNDSGSDSDSLFQFRFLRFSILILSRGRIKKFHGLNEGDNHSSFWIKYSELLYEF